MPNNKEPQVTKPRGREIRNGISHKCATGRCNDCSSMRCTHDCGHGIEQERIVKRSDTPRHINQGRAN